MKKFLTRLSVFIISYLILVNIFAELFPYYWGNPWFASKIAYLKSSGKDHFNSYFFGSSRIYRQINPQVFDQLVNVNSNEIVKSFNLGAPATFCPQSYYLLEHFLESDLSQNAKYLFMELTEVDEISSDLIDEERSSYWITFKEFSFALHSFISNENLSSLIKARNFAHYFLSYGKSIFHIGHFGQNLTEKNYFDEEYVGLNGNGFYPLEEHLKSTSNPIVKENLIDRNSLIIEDPRVLEKRKSESLECYNKTTKKFDKIHLKRILHLIEKSKLKGIHLIFILSPRNKVNELVTLGERIPKEHFIDISDPRKYPELYSMQYSFDIGHLNSKGANFFSQQLAIELIAMHE